MTSPADWPPSVTPGQTITDTWGNQVVAGIRLQPAFVRGQKTGIAIAGGVGDNQLSLVGAAGLVDPKGLLFNQGIYVQTGWAGLWSVHAVWACTSANLGMCTVWFEVGTTRYAQHSAALGSHGAGASSNELATSTIIPVPPETIIEFHVDSANTQTMNVDFAACWIGPPV